MKKLTKIRLINWHYFANETIIIKNNTLLSGQNASGKSTILDAISFVTTPGEQYFNLAANEKGKRDIRGYVRCKIGLDNQEYLRPLDTTAHIALEFQDEKTKEYFTTGTVIDVTSDITPPKTIFYVSNNKITESLFIDENNLILDTINFKKAKQNLEVFLTKKEARKAFRNRFGSINESFFTLIHKALAFKPIGDVKEFIYQHLLEEKDIEVDNIRESIRAYNELELILKTIKEKINDLKEIEIAYQNVMSAKERQDYNEYISKLIDLEVNYQNIEKSQNNIVKLENKQFSKTIELERIDRELESLDEKSKELYLRLYENNDFKTMEYFDKQIISTTQSIHGLKYRYEEYVRKVGTIRDLLSGLKKLSNNRIYDDLLKINYTSVEENKIDEVKNQIYNLEMSIKDHLNSLNQLHGKYEIAKQESLKEISEITRTLRNLENKKLRYNPTLVSLKEELEAGLYNIYGTQISVHVLAELLEITDLSWQNTIEDYLGQQRFNLIVDPRYFDSALNLFNRIKNVKNVYGIGLVNTKKITNYNKYDNRSLASIIISDNIDAKRYINMTIGNLIMCDDIRELENYHSSITKDGVVYKNFTVRTLYKQTEKPFIGKKAHEQQSKIWNDKAEIEKSKYLDIQDKLNSLKSEINEISKIDFKTLGSGLEIRLNMDKNTILLDELKVKKNSSTKDSTNELELEYNDVKNQIKDCDIKIRQIYEEIAKIKANIDKEHHVIHQAKLNIEEIMVTYQNILNANLHFEQQANDFVETELRKTTNLSLLQNEYHKRYDLEKMNVVSLIDTLTSKQLKYDNKYISKFSFGLQAMPSYLDELEKLIKSELIQYENKVRKAKEDAEVIFKEDFLTKLRSYILAAKEEIEKINLTLKQIKFGEDTYEFIFPKSKQFGDLYEMVTSRADIENGTNLFTNEFSMRYEAQLDELFTALSLDEANSQGRLNKYTDYRTYMDYDIRITNANNDQILYSKVFKEKSGGETQVPFYVAILASFVRVYHHNKNDQNTSIGLVLFDEVFDKMDPTRTKAMMEFINKLPIQILLATPSEKLAVLHKYTDTTIIVTREKHKASTHAVHLKNL